MDKTKILEAIDIVCLNCVEDTLTDNSCCENCPVRKTADSLNKKKKEFDPCTTSPTTTEIKSGNRYTLYSDYSNYAKFNYSTVVIERQGTLEEADEKVQPLYLCKTESDSTIWAYPDELYDI